VIIVLVEDGEPTSVEETGLIEDADENIHRIILHNKIDLSGSSPGIDKQDDTHIWLSMKTSAGYDLLISHLKQFMGVQELPEDSYMARRRHLDALSRSKEILLKALVAHEGHQAPELLAEDLREAHQALEEITGEFSSDDLLGKIFSEFCIGK
jgi:tRNA modification GTPase